MDWEWLMSPTPEELGLIECQPTNRSSNSQRPGMTLRNGMEWQEVESWYSISVALK